MHLEDDLIDRSAEEGSRLLVLELLHDCDAVAEKLKAGTDGEALHDFRVGLRRLRTALRTFKPWLEDSVRSRHEKRLRDLTRRTNGARDGEVLLELLADAHRRVGARERPGVDFLSERLKARQLAASRGMSRVVNRYERLSAKLARRIRHVRVSTGHAVTFGPVLGRLLGDQVAALEERLGSATSGGDAVAIHRARIEGKRLRYLLEPLRGNRHADAGEAVRQLKELQDVLGALNDHHLLARETEAALVDAAGARARKLFHITYEAEAGPGRLKEALRNDPRSGLLAMLRLAREVREKLLGELERSWRAGGRGALSTAARDIASRLQARAGRKLETERKWLLSGVPPVVEKAPAFDIDQGCLPGEHVRELLRRVRGPEGERYWRGFKQESGLTRLETEEETSLELFDLLWPLTEGRRVAKRRWRVREGDTIWEIDQFTDRHLLLAAAELSPAFSSVELPEWLVPHVEREVTGNPAYSDEALALSGFSRAAAAR
ncbi:MAG TPA: CHAD domain-containing protein [Anaeromyxobacteraceae bacterium]|nr:CHAD domain-containing protein [Anaeromyxobacteraceae bacterium]